jgi:membrane protein required for colicin V production
VNGADWIIIAGILIAVAQAASEGFFSEVFSIAGLVAGYIVAAWQYHRLADYFAPYLTSPWLGEIAGFLIIFVAVVIAAGIVGRIVRWAVHKAGLSVIDRVLGAGLGAIKGALIVSVVLMGMAAFTPTSRYLQSSQLAPYFLVVGRAAIWVAPPGLRARFFQGLDMLSHAQGNGEWHDTGK